MKVENIISNGISYNEPAQDSSGDMIKIAVSLYRMRHSEKEIFDMFPEGEYYSGTRFNSDSDITTRICSALTKNAVSHHMCSNFSRTDDEVLLLEGLIKSFVDSLSGTEMDAIILDAMRNCASTDHYYALGIFI